MELLCIETHNFKEVIAGKIYNSEGSFSCICGDKHYKIINYHHNTHLPRVCNSCDKIIPRNSFSIKRFVEIGIQDEHSNYETKEQLIEKL